MMQYLDLFFFTCNKVYQYLSCFIGLLRAFSGVHYLKKIYFTNTLVLKFKLRDGKYGSWNKLNKAYVSS